MKPDLWQKKFFIFMVLLAGILPQACDNTGDDDQKEGGKNRIYVMSPAESPEGVGVDLESDSSYGLDASDIPAGWVYDIRLRTIKGVTTSGTSKGCPHIKLYKKEAKAYKYGLTGKSAYAAIMLSDVVEANLVADLVDEIDDSAVMNASSKYDYNLLQQYYETNFVTKTSANWLPSPWIVGEDEVIFIIKTTAGNYFKLIILGMGTTSGSQPGSGSIEVMFEKL